MVIQCPNCSSKFNLADDKVTEKGLKVRCSKCKNIFEVKKDTVSKPEVISKSKAGEEEDKFNFGEDFDFGDEAVSTERPPSPAANKDRTSDKRETPAPAPPKKETEEFSLEKEADFESNKFGGESKKADMGMSPEMPEIPGSGSGDHLKVDGNFFSEGLDDFKIDRGSEIPAQGKKSAAPAPPPAAPAESDEEFDFSAKLDSYARPEAPSRNKPEASDDLEAKLDLDTETPSGPAPAASAQVREPPRAAPGPSRPAPLTYDEEKKSGLKIFLILLLVLILLSPVGGLLYLNSTGSFTFADAKAANFAKLKAAPEVEKLLVALKLKKKELKGEVNPLREQATYSIIQRNEGGSVAVVQGKVRNDWPVPVRGIQVEATLYDANRNALAVGYSYADVSFTKTELASMSQQDIEGWMDALAGRNMKNNEVLPGEARDFAAVFFVIPAGVASFDVKTKTFELIKGSE